MMRKKSNIEDFIIIIMCEGEDENLNEKKNSFCK